MKASVIVPVLYTEPQLGSTLRRLADLRDKVDLEIVLVVDVPDPEREVEARSSNRQSSEEVGAVELYRIGERGFGSALRDGFAKAGGDVLIPFMGDACDNPEDIPRLILEVERGLDVVAGARYMKGGGIVGDTAKQRISRLYSWIMRLLGGPPIHDVSNAFKAYRRPVVEAVQTEARSFDVSVELTLKAWQQGFRLGEIPTVWTNRRQGTSKFRFFREVRNYGRWLVLAAKHGARGRRPKVRRGP
jgi:dolichol-phosphate mannosyltransferase